MDTNSIFHDGEIQIHERLDIKKSMQSKGKTMISFEISFALQIFYHLQSMIFVGSIDKNGYPWSSILTGEPGFSKALNPKTLNINATPINGDPLLNNIGTGNFIGTLTIEFIKRKRRGRINGVIIPSNENNGITLSISQAYSNCAKYIQTREVKFFEIEQSVDGTEISETKYLTENQMSFIKQADTFFLSSYYIEDTSNHSHGVDISHRGGNPGFIKVNSKQQIIFPDYKGNNAFNSMGNILKNPVAGLLFINFETGSTLQITGDTETITEPSKLIDFNGAVGLVQLSIVKVVEIKNAIDYRWALIDLAKSNP